MTRRLPFLAVLLATLLLVVACTNKHVQNPIANLDSKQPDKVLFDRAMDALKHNKFDVARITLQTLINTYPDSEYVARAKLAVADSWYAEGGSAGLAQAEIEYKDFITFFPNMPEAAEAQLKVANIHYRQMEKPDRDFTHAKRSEEEYRQLILQFPDSKLVPEAKQRLLEVQEVLAEREYRIGRFYYLRESWPAAIARLKSLTDTYPLYSQVDEALFMLGDAYEKEVERVRAAPLPEQMKGKLIKDFEDQAAETYAKILTRYPVMGRAADAKKRLETLHRPIPSATPEAIAQNKSEEASRREAGRFGKLMLNFHRRPDTSLAAKVGDPTLVDPRQTSATDVSQRVNETVRQAASPAGGGNTVSVETVGAGAPAPNEPAPRSDTPSPSGSAQPSSSAPANNDSSSPATGTGAGGSEPNNESSIPELAPNPGNAAPAAQPLPPPAQVNEVTSGQASNSSTASSSGSGSQAGATDTSNQDQQPEQGSSSSKGKKKKGVRKLIPF